MRNRWHHSSKGEDIAPKGEELWSATGSLWGARLLTIQFKKPAAAEEGRLDLDTYEVRLQADILTNIPGIHALTAWRCYNAGAVVEHRIEELVQLSTGKTAVDHLGGNALLWGLSALTYQTLHTLRRHFLTGSWRTAQPKRIRLWMIRLPAKLTTHGRKTDLQLLRDEPLRPPAHASGPDRRYSQRDRGSLSDSNHTGAVSSPLSNRSSGSTPSHRTSCLS